MQPFGVRYKPTPQLTAPDVPRHLSHFIQVPMRTNANMRLLCILALQPSRSTHTVVLKDFSASVVDACERSYSDVDVVCQEWLARKMWTQSSVLQVLDDGLSARYIPG
jgi:hypothetical protein